MRTIKQAFKYIPFSRLPKAVKTRFKGKVNDFPENVRYGYYIYTVWTYDLPAMVMIYSPYWEGGCLLRSNNSPATCKRPRLYNV